MTSSSADKPSTPAPIAPNSSFKPTVFGRPVLRGMKTFDSVAQRRRLNFALGIGLCRVVTKIDP